MGLYINSYMVKVRLAGRVRFTDTPEVEPNKMPNGLLRDLILQAEGDVELALSQRYATPFQTIDGCAFGRLLDRPTKNVIRSLCVLKAVMIVLDTDYGSGGTSDASKYYKTQEARYEKLLKDLMATKEGSFNIFILPPLEGLRLNWQNESADTGFRGRVLLHTGEGADSDSYGASQVNRPGRTFWNPEPSDYLCEDVEIRVI